jgi:hypothetical protein
MRGTAILAVGVVVLIGFGWMIGRAQIGAPEFEFVIDAPEGRTDIECVKGCKLAWNERGLSGEPQTKFYFSCRGGNAGRCSSGRIGGWIER